ncbi:N-formylglutamate amidohydrolase [Kordiimonas sp.]|uniref:N-formylglutamate amidohydrolase n=1 Tax=Kordiimonas sp. TaxID=1970157 RepID=UPI003A907F5B
MAMTEDGPDKSNSGETPPPFVLKSAVTPNAFVFAAPHSGRHYPGSMIRAANLETHSLRLSEDAYVDRLFAAAPEHGANLLVATHARAYLDLNRAENELDPDMFNPPLEEGDLDITHRVRAGLGIIPKLIAEGMPIYEGTLPAREALFRISNVYRPYHDKLASLLDARKAQFGRAVLIDCHSMPSETPAGRRRGRSTGPDIVLGDNWGASCDRELTSLAEELLIRAGFSVRRNVPYSGGFSTQHYGKPNSGYHALQIELSRGLYMHESTLQPLQSFPEVEKKLGWFVGQLIETYTRHMGLNRADELPRAAE